MVHDTCDIKVLLMMAKGSLEDIFEPLMWATEKARTYWDDVAGQDMMTHVKQMEGYAIGSMKGGCRANASKC